MSTLSVIALFSSQTQGFCGSNSYVCCHLAAFSNPRFLLQVKFYAHGLIFSAWENHPGFCFSELNLLLLEALSSLRFGPENLLRLSVTNSSEPCTCICLVQSGIILYQVRAM